MNIAQGILTKLISIQKSARTFIFCTPRQENRSVLWKNSLCLWISLQTLQVWIGWDILYQYSNSSSRHSVKINTPSHPPRRQLWFGWLQILIFLSPSIRLHSENMTVANNWNRVSSESSMPMRSETLNILLIWFLRTFSLQHVLSDVQTSLQIHSPSKIQLSKNGPHH